MLTHTNAGVAALRARLARAGVQGNKYRISTIDGFAMRLIGKFPLRSGHNPKILEVQQPRTDYPAIRESARVLLHAGHLNEALSATYSRMFVDEYQDCNLVQHAIVSALAHVLPTCVLGDPLQAIFGFNDNPLVDWTADVETTFPPAGQLQTPWRWRLVGTEDLGQWLLATREQLRARGAVDLRYAPNEVRWIQLQAGSEVQQRLAAARTDAPNGQGSVLIIGDAINVQGRHQLTSQTPGAQSVESVDLRDFVEFARGFDLKSVNPLQQLLKFAASVMTGVTPTAMANRVATIRGGRARTPPTPAEHAAIRFSEQPTMVHALHILDTLAAQQGARVYRPVVLSCCRAAMQSAITGSADLLAAALKARERNRHLARPVSRRCVGSTLLLKGLEAEVAVILQPEAMNASNLYVALTRGSRQLVVCSRTPVLTPAQVG